MTDATPAQRSAAVDHLCELAARGALDVDGLEATTARALSATTEAELALVLGAVPGAVRWTPVDECMDEPRRVEVRGGSVELVDGWQLASTTEIHVAGGRVLLDLASVSFDDVVTDLVVSVRGGRVEIVVPSGVHVLTGDVDRAGGSVDDRIGETVALPGMPTIRLTTQTAGGRIELRRPALPRPPRRGLFRRRR